MSVNAVSSHYTDYQSQALAQNDTHVVQRGETLSQIAQQYGVPLEQLIAANPQIANPNVIYPDQQINLPTGGRGGDGAPVTAVAQTSGGQSPSGMSLSQNGLDLIKGFEGLRLNAYQDSAGVWTIGYGHTGPDVRPGMSITQAQAEQLLRQDVARFEQAVRDNVRVPLTQNQFDALVSFTYNVGEGALQDSTLLRKLNAGDYAGAQTEFGRWVYAGGERLEGLERRRAAEAALFGGQAPEGTQPSNPQPQPNEQGGGAGTYTVRSGDTLSGIAQRHGVSLDALLAHPENAEFRGNPNLIHPGQVVHIPGGGSGANGGGTHTVRSGDTLSGIAQQHGVSLNALLAHPQNGEFRSNPNLIYPGQVVHIPGGGSTQSPSPSEPAPAPNGQAPSYTPWTVYSTGERPPISLSHPDQMQPHHDYQTRVRQGQTLEVADVVLHRPGQSQTAQQVPSPVSGTVETVAYQAGGAGHYVVLRGDRGELVYLFHFSGIGVQQGQRVEYGQSLGTQGSTGNSTGPHVHIEAPSSVIDRWVHDLLDGRFDGTRTN